MARSNGMAKTRLQLAASIGCVVLLAAGLAGWSLLQSYRLAEERAFEHASNLALSLDRSIGHTVEATDAALRAALDGLSLPDITEASAGLRRAALFGSVLPSGLDGLAISDADGNILERSTRRNLGPSNVADRQYFQAHKASSDLGLTISAPLVNRNNAEWSIVLSRRITRPDGSFGGVVLGTLALTPIREFFGSLHLKEGSNISLFNTDRHLVVRWPGTEQDSGREIRTSRLYDALATARSGTFRGSSSVDGQERFYAYSRIGSMPLVIGVGLSSAGVLQEWGRTAFPNIWLTALFISAVVASALALRSAWRRRVRAEKRALRSAARLSGLFRPLDALIQNSPDALQIVEVKPDGGFAFEMVSPSLLTLYNVDSPDIAGQTPEQCLPPDTAAHVVECWRECVQARRQLTFQYTVFSGTAAREIEKFIAPVFDETGRVFRLVGVIRDVTHRNNTERSLRQSQKMELIGQLTAGVAHDFNNLLQSVIGGLDLLQPHLNTSDEAHRCLGIARKAAFRGSALTHRLLTASRQQELDPGLIDLPEMLDEVLELCESTLGPHIKFSHTVDADIWPLLVDSAQLVTCLMNLAVNARDAMPGGGNITISARNVSFGDPSMPEGLPCDAVVITVRDDGVGMPPAILARASDPFFTTKPVGKGSGLGLAMVQGFAAQSGGTITISSEHRKGTTVEVWLPRARAVQSSSPVPKPVRSEHGNGHVLLVDDNEDVGATLKLMLERGGFTVTYVTSGAAALAWLEHGIKFDILLTDYAMPGMSGAQLVSDIRQLAPDIPAALITGYSQAVLSDGQLPPETRLIRKPVRQDDLICQMTDVLKSTSQLTVGPPAPEQLPGNVVRFSPRPAAMHVH